MTKINSVGWHTYHHSETGQLSTRGLYLSRAAVDRHIAASKPCLTAKMGIREIQVNVQTSDVMAGAGGAAGPAPDVRQQTAGTVRRECKIQWLYTFFFHEYHHGMHAGSLVV